jgi:hypothetical protein
MSGVTVDGLVCSFKGVLKGASSLQFLGDHCGLPFAGVATALIGGVATAYAEVNAKLA